MASDIIAAALNAPFRSFEEAEDYLTDIAKRSGVAHLSYWHMDMDQGELEDIVWLSTYDHHYMSTYMARYTPHGDPVITRLLKGESFVDWRDHQPTNSTDNDVHVAANRVGIFINGFSIGFEVRPNKLVVFSVSGLGDEAEWDRRIQSLYERFSAFAHQFQYRMAPILRRRVEDTWLMAV